MPDPLAALVERIRQCRLCEAHLPLGPRPVLRARSSARLLIVGQAPGAKVHESGIPWNDASGIRLRHWIGLERERFYDERHVAIVPMGFCYPGRGSAGDLPPRPECAQTWHAPLLALLPHVELTLLVGHYAQAYVLGERRRKTLTETVRAYRDYMPSIIPLPHPSPRNQLWVRDNPWFEADVVPLVRGEVAAVMQGAAAEH